MLERTRERAGYVGNRVTHLSIREISSLVFALLLGLLFWLGGSIPDELQDHWLYHAIYGACLVAVPVYVACQLAQISFGRAERTLAQILDNLLSGLPGIVIIVAAVTGRIENGWQWAVAAGAGATVLVDLFFVNGAGATKSKLSNEITQE